MGVKAQSTSHGHLWEPGCLFSGSIRLPYVSRRRLDEDEIGRLNEDNSRWGRRKRRRRGWKRRRRREREGERGIAGRLEEKEPGGCLESSQNDSQPPVIYIRLRGWSSSLGIRGGGGWVAAGGKGTILLSLPTAIEKVKHTPTRGHVTSRRERERVRHLPSFTFHVHKRERGAQPSMRINGGRAELTR